MSGDVQPRKRKDKKKKRDAFDRKSEGELSFSRHQSFQEDDESSHGVHITKMAGDDVHLHVHHEHGTGGHWCAKVFFFSLLAILLGLVALIILENRGLSDLDTPLSESRFSNYFDGWVEENRQEHDDHDPVQASIEDHDEHDEPFDEEEDHSELDEEAADEDEDEDEEEEQEASEDGEGDEEDEEQTVEQTIEEDDDDNATTEATAEEDDNADADDEDDDDDEDADNALQDETAEQMVEDDDDNDDDGNDDDANNDDDADDNNTNENTIEASQENAKSNNADDDADDDDNDDDDDDETNEVEEHIKPIYARSAQQMATSQQSNANNDDDDDDADDTFDEEDDDGTFESLENVVDNDAEELLLLQEKARQQAAEAAKNEPASTENDGDDDDAESAPSWANSLAVKIGVGVALALVARLVLIRNNPNTTDESAPEASMKRRLTIASAEDTYPDDEDAPPLSDDEYSEEEIEIEEEIEYVEDDEIEMGQGDDEEMPIIGKYVPETFEQLNAMYRLKGSEIAATEAERVEELKTKTAYNRSPTATTARKPLTAFNAPPTPPSAKDTKIIQAPTKTMPTPTTSTIAPETEPSKSTVLTATPSPKPTAKQYTPDSPVTTTKHEVTHDVDYQPDDDDIDYDEDDDIDDDGEEMGEEEEEDIDDDLIDDDEEISDVDDAELMSRLEAKYGRLPAKEYESDEDPDDPTWTQIKPKDRVGGGPQAHDDEYDLYEEELRRANEEMMRERYGSAAKAFALLTQQHPDRPAGFLGKALALDRLAELQRSNKLLDEALDAFKRYLAFGALIEDDVAYRAAATRCIERLRFMGHNAQAVPIHEQLIERFDSEPDVRNQLAVTYLLMNRLAAAKQVLQEILGRWPLDGFAQVHYGFVLRQQDKDYENAVVYLRHGINSKAPGTQDGRFFFNLGDSLQRLGRQAEALEVYERGAALQLFPSAYQRSLYNEPDLRAQPFWTKEETTYAAYLDKLEHNWQAIRDEALSVLSRRGYFMDETESLRDTGNWQQFELYARGQRRQQNCQKAPITCSLIGQFSAASGCRRGQVKFSIMQPGTHVYPHCGPTNCRLRAHLGLVVPAGTRLRVADEERTWTEGKFLIFDDSFEHEVWHNGSSFRLVLIVDVWHPDLSAQQRQSLAAI